MSGEIEKWQLKKLIKELKNLRGTGTSVITQYIPPNTNVAQYVSRLNSEYGLADANIKSAVNKKSVLEGITAALTRLKDYNKTGENGLVILAGNVILNGREKRMSLGITPYKPLNLSKYHCDNCFYLDPLENLLQDSQKYGFIIMDGSETLFGTLHGQQKEVLRRKQVTLPKKHKKGGQSSQRFQRIRLEKRGAYIKEISELSTKHFIDNNEVNVDGIVLAGHAEFKRDLANGAFLDQRLKDKIVAIVDISYGGEAGFNQAVNLVSEQLGHLELIKEIKIIKDFFNQITDNTGLCIFGPRETFSALQAGVVSSLIINENFDYYYNEKEQTLTKTPPNDDAALFVDWIADNYNNLGVELHFVTDQTSEGHQFKRGFAGIAGILRYPFTPEYDDTTENKEQDNKDNDNDNDKKNENSDPQTKQNETVLFTEDDFM